MSDDSTERKFIHDLSSPLGVASGMVENVLDNRDEFGLSAEAVRQLELALSALLDASRLVHERRECLRREREGEKKEAA